VVDAPRTAVLHLATFGMGDNKNQEIFPGLEFKGPEKGTQSMAEFVSPAKIGTSFYNVFIAEYHQSVNQKCQKVQDAISKIADAFILPLDIICPKVVICAICREIP
jgi:hypothetical protein